LREWTGEEPKVPSGKGLRGRTMRAVTSLAEAYLKGMTVCCEVHPTLGTEPQNILADRMYLVSSGRRRAAGEHLKAPVQHIRDIDGLTGSDRHNAG